MRFLKNLFGGANKKNSDVGVKFDKEQLYGKIRNYFNENSSPNSVEFARFFLKENEKDLKLLEDTLYKVMILRDTNNESFFPKNKLWDKVIINRDDVISSGLVTGVKQYFEFYGKIGKLYFANTGGLVARMEFCSFQENDGENISFYRM